MALLDLPFSGKTTLFQTITKTLLDTSHLSKPETHLAVIKVPDARLDKLTEIFNPKKKVNAVIEFIDVAGLKSDESGSVKFSGNFLGNVKNNDALILVVRLFKDESVVHSEGSLDMMRDINLFETEFILSDLGIVEKRIESLKKQILKTQDDMMKRELALLEKCKGHLENEKSLRDVELSKDELAF